jgi:uncharacterized repeat protein (TIGR03803 family)
MRSSFNSASETLSLEPLVISNNILYGTTFGGGSNDGTLFAINTNGTGFTNLYSFSGDDGEAPAGGLGSSGDNLYGTTSQGGTNDGGTVFAIKTDGTGFTNLYNFNTVDGFPSYPSGELALSSNTLYGTTEGSLDSDGTVFRINANGTDFTNLYSFTVKTYNSSVGQGTNADGSNPIGGLVKHGNTLYGTAEYGGFYGCGTVFRIDIDGTGFTNLYNFSVLSNGANSDGAAPIGGLMLFGNTLYGTTTEGGVNGDGTLFQINTDGTGFANLHDFNGTDGSDPGAVLVLSGNTLYGTTSAGGSSGGGGVFALSLGPIPLNLQLIGGAAVLNWGNPAFILQSATKVSGTYNDMFGAASPYTNVITDSPMFFRLRAN